MVNIKEDSIKNKAPIIIIGFRPILSDIFPKYNWPITLENPVAETSKDIKNTDAPMLSA